MKAIFHVFVLLALGLSSCTSSKNKEDHKTGHAIEVVDTQGNTVVLDSIPERVVCLFDPSVDVIYMLQAQDKLVGIAAETYFDKEIFDYLKHLDPRIANKEIATPGSNEMLNIESVIALKPDLVIAQNVSPSVIKTLNGMGIPVYLASSESYEDLMQEMKDLSVLLGKEERGEELIQYATDKVTKSNVFFGKFSCCASIT